VQRSGHKSFFSRLVKPFNWKTLHRVVFIQVLIIFLAIILTIILGRNALENYITTQVSREQIEYLKLVKHFALNKKVAPEDWCSIIEGQETRLTVISWDGEVICDSIVDNVSMDSHSNRPEVILARKHSIGTAKRYSNTLNMKMMYGAILITLNEGKKVQKYIIRQSRPLSEIGKAFLILQKGIFIIFLPVSLLICILPFWASYSIWKPLPKFLRKAQRLTSFNNTTQEGQDEWGIFEETLDQVKVDFDSYVEKIYLDNVKMNTLLESLSESILAVNRSYKVIFANRKFKRNFLKENIKAVDLFNLDIFEIEQIAALKEYFDKVLFQNHEKIKNRNLQFSVKNGQELLYFDVILTPLKDVQGQTFGVVTVFRDVTARRMMEQLREDFVANVSHEVRTPLTAIKGYIQLLKGIVVDADDTQKEYFEKIESNSDRLTGLFNDILNLSVIESKDKIDYEPIVVEEICSHIVANVKHSYVGKEITLETDFQKELIFADGALMEQVLTNLIDNAFKYTSSGGRVKISSYEKEDKSIIKVEDSGHGIPMESMSRIFERFYRVDASRSREVGGTGLGLSIVKHIVQKHSGRVWVESELGVGSSFFVEISSEEKL
jgi:two-component system phosphate regulon sensor histidine kinase PhoR